MANDTPSEPSLALAAAADQLDRVEELAAADALRLVAWRVLPAMAMALGLLFLALSVIAPDGSWTRASLASVRRHARDVLVLRAMALALALPIAVAMASPIRDLWSGRVVVSRGRLELVNVPELSKQRPGLVQDRWHCRVREQQTGQGSQLVPVGAWSLRRLTALQGQRVELRLGVRSKQLFSARKLA